MFKFKWIKWSASQTAVFEVNVVLLKSWPSAKQFNLTKFSKQEKKINMAKNFAQLILVECLEKNKKA